MARKRTPTATTTLATQPARHINAGAMVQLDAAATDERVIAMWLNASSKRGKRKSEATQQLYAASAAAMLQHVAKPLQAVTLEDLQTWQASLTGSPATVKARTAAVRSLFSFAQRMGYLAFNVAALLPVPDVADTKHRKVVDVADVQLLLRVLDSGRTLAGGKLGLQEHTRTLLRALVHVAYSSGARVSELLSLTWEDIQPRTGGTGGAVLRIVRGKGGKSRQAGISGKAYAALVALRGSAPATSPVFATRKGTALDRHAADRLLAKAAKAAGISGTVSMHWLRHSHVTHALAAGAAPQDVQQQVGHASLHTTSSYAHAQSYSSDKLQL